MPERAIHSSHHGDQIEAMTMADKIVVMRDGIVEQVGSPLELYDRPADTFVAGLIGSPSMNFFSGAMTAEGFVTQDGTTTAPVHLFDENGAPMKQTCGQIDV